MAAATWLTELLQTAPELTVLVTSRVRLNLMAEVALTVPPLPVPDEAVLVESLLDGLDGLADWQYGEEKVADVNMKEDIQRIESLPRTEIGASENLTALESMRILTRSVSVDPNLAFLAIFSRDCRDFGVIYSDFGYRKQPISYLKIAQI
ncbi:hypothetical protein KFU94_56490 [Chloroflexi bacterium TSY]|nr:hypothetical protein [Chloroflexi bacterium TSY]